MTPVTALSSVTLTDFDPHDVQALVQSGSSYRDPQNPLQLAEANAEQENPANNSGPLMWAAAGDEDEDEADEDDADEDDDDEEEDEDGDDDDEDEEKDEDDDEDEDEDEEVDELRV